MKWFRFYSEFRSDPKMRRMPIAHRYAFVILLCLASESETRGVITGLDDDDIAYELEMPTEDWQTLKAKFRTKGLIEFERDRIIICNWDKRQFASDSSAERVARHREKTKKRPCNVTVTDVKRHVTPSDTDPDSEADTYSDPEQKEKRVSADAARASDPANEEEVFQTRTIPVKSSSPTQSQEATHSAEDDRCPANLSKKKIDYEAFKDLFNDRKPAMWAEMKVINSDRQKHLKKLVQDFGSQENALEALGQALDAANSEEWYQARRLTFDNLASNGKIYQLFERHQARLNQGFDMSEAELRESFEAVKRQREIYASIADL
jgi:hypothetical protein